MDIDWPTTGTHGAMYVRQCLCQFQKSLKSLPQQ